MIEMVPDKDDSLGITVGGAPSPVEEEGLGEGGIGGDEHSFDPPFVKNLLPALPHIRNGLGGFLQQIAGIEIGAAVGKEPILRVEIPDRVSSPVIEREELFWQTAGTKEGDRMAGEQIGLSGTLPFGQQGPPPEREDGEERERGGVGKRPESLPGRAKRRRPRRLRGMRESARDDGHGHEDKYRNVADGIESGQEHKH